MPFKSDKKMCGMPAHYVKIVGIGSVVVALAITGIVLGVVLTRDDGTDVDRPWDAEYRLPEQLHAEHYELVIHPDLDADLFKGTLTLTLNLTAPLAFLPLHQKGLNVSNPVLETVSNLPPHRSARVIDIADSFDAPINEFFIVRPTAALDAGRYKLSVKFEGSLRQPELVGIYSSSYAVPGSSVTKKLVTSKFEPTYARRAFPCLDEPDRKATFTISLVKPKDAAAPWTALSNMNETTTIDGPGADEQTTKFTKSVKMSTYLACFIVSQFGYNKADPVQITNLDGSKFDLRTYAAPASVPKTKFARDAAASITSYYIEYFNIDYPLPKLDLIAIPDFVSGAMEHWGLITFRETNMLVNTDETKTAASSFQQVGMVVAHELAHMWFGNLVTMKWWDDLWLNEGFASYIEYKGLAQFKKDWRLMDQFVIMDLQPVMALDAQLSSHPIIQPVAHPDQITELFDTITYSKGSAVIRMLEGMVGEEVFRAGVTSYLNEFRFGNAVTNDLWAALSAAAEAAGQSIDVERVMNTWTLQMGLPVVEMNYDSTTGRAVLRQKRFFATPGAEKKAATLKDTSPFSYRWDIPLTFYSNVDGETKTKWFKKEDSSVEIDFDPSLTPFINMNKDQIGFYRVNYDTEMWKKLGLAASALQMSGVDRSALLDDVFSLADGTYVEYSQALDFAKYLSKEDDWMAWSTASTKFLKMLPFISTRLAYTDFKDFIAAMVEAQYKSLTWDIKPDEDYIKTRLRSTVLNLACSCDYPECVTGASKRFGDWLGTENKVPEVNVRQLVYNFGMKWKGHEGDKWDRVWQKYMVEEDSQEKLKLMVSLAHVRDVGLLKKYLTLAEDEANVRGQDYFTVLQSISDNNIGQPIVWDYVRNNWEKLVERFTLNSRSLGRLIPRITQNFDTQLQLNELKAFFEKYPDAGAGASARKQALERVEANMQWLELHYDKIEGWLKFWNGPKTSV